MLSVEDLNRQVKDIDNKIAVLKKEKERLLSLRHKNKNAQRLSILENAITEIEKIDGSEFVCYFLTRLKNDLENYTFQITDRIFVEKIKDCCCTTENQEILNIINNVCLKQNVQ